jgi:TolA-binding protein
VVSRRFALRGMVLGSCFALAAVGGWAVRPYLPGPDRPSAAPGPVSESTEALIARLDELRSQKEELRRKENEFAQQVRNQRWEIEQQEASLLAELKKREEANQRRLVNLGHRTPPALAYAR